MKNLLATIAFSVLATTPFAQAKKTTVKKTAATSRTINVSTEPAFLKLQYVTEISDVNVNSNNYHSIKTLVEDHHVLIAFADKKFMGSETLKRGEFIVHFNSALESVKRYMDSRKQDTSLINTYDRNRSYITEVSEIRDLKPESVYYPSVQSMLEKWGIAAMFKKDKKLNATGTMTEAEVYDILHVTMGYNNAAVSKRAVPIKRDAFAVLLADAIIQIRERIRGLPMRQPDVVRDTFYIQKPFDSTRDK